MGGDDDGSDELFCPCSIGSASSEDVIPIVRRIVSGLYIFVLLSHAEVFLSFNTCDSLSFLNRAAVVYQDAAKHTRKLRLPRSDQCPAASQHRQQDTNSQSCCEWSFHKRDQ